MARTLIATAVIAACLAAAPLSAQDCGPLPGDPPIVPDGATVEREDIVKARQQIIAYSDKVEKYLGCMDKRFSKLRVYMSKDAQNRYEEDIAKIANQRTETQVAINKAIRAYRRRQNTNS